MNRIWFQVLAVIIFGSLIKYLIVNVFAWVIIDLAVLLVSYLILKRQPFINLRQSMIFLSGLTLVNVLLDLNVLNAIMSNLILLILVGWMIFRNGFSDFSGNRRTRR